MNRRAEFGVVGGYGATGRAVVSELLRSGEFEVVIGGRDPGRLEAFAAESGSRISPIALDVRDARSLDAFCSQCSVVVNCAGPVVLLQDRVAQAALRAHCHYVDPAGMSVVKERMLPHAREIEDSGLSFVVSAGWMPGITELLPACAHAQAKSRMEAIDTVSVYSSDSGNWSESALRDGVSYLRRVGLSRPGYFRKGAWVHAGMSDTSHKVDLGDPIGVRRCSLFSMPELNEVGRGLTDCEFRTYAYLSGFRNAVAAIMIAVLPLSDEAGIRLLRGIFRRNRLPVAGFVVVRVVGRAQARRAVLRSRIEFDAGRDYWMNGVALAATARMISAGQGVRAGVRYLFDAVNPTVLVAKLREAGVRQIDSFDFQD